MDVDNSDSCSICNDPYDDVLRPRCLPCGHNFCGSCIKNSIKDDTLLCPHCQKPYPKSDPNDFPINYGMEALIAEMRKLKPPEPPKGPIKQVLQSSILEGKWNALLCDQKRSLNNLIKLSNEMANDLNEYTDFLCQRREMHKEQIQKIQDLANKKDELIQQIDTERQMISDTLGERKDHKEKAAGNLSKHESVTVTKDIMTACDDLKECCETLEVWSQRVRKQLPSAWIIDCSEKLMKDATAVLKTVGRIDDNSESEKAVFDLSTSSLTVMDKVKRIREPALSLSELQSMSKPVKDLLEKGHVYAIQTKERQTRSAKLSLEDDKIFLHCLINEEPPIYAYTVQQSSLIETLDTDTTTVFFDLSWEGQTQGRMFIQLAPSTPLAKHFRTLCTGDLGPSYLNTSILAVDNAGQSPTFVYGGDYSKNDGTGGAPLFTGLDPWDNIYYRRPKSGAVSARFWDKNGPNIAQFAIKTSNVNNKLYARAVFGQVSEGLELINLAAKQNDIRQVKIEDCGVILPSTVETQPNSYCVML
ncbi:hypothetical protein SK128_028107 [Halocaridina rubra]|uniref:RING-type domain-containing protein n=1 Tax=Halocaridina rubra TaxID=373956 RepID=A0AAN8WIB9_HALRR